MPVAKIVARKDSEIAFHVDDVAPATAPLHECPAVQAVHDTVHMKIDSASEHARKFVPVANGLFGVVRRAFMDHRPLVLTPDSVWQTLCQGFADHVNADPEGLRAKLVPHAGKKKLVVREELLGQSPENPWDSVFERFAGLVRKNALAPSVLDVDFTTTGPIERVARAIAIMDAFQAFFDYEVDCICGIPWVRLEGTEDDWKRLAEKAEGFAQFGLDWWLKALRPVLGKLHETASGKPDQDFWRKIYTFRSQGEEGGCVPNFDDPLREFSGGWILRLFPYVGTEEKRKNPVVLDQAKEIESDAPVCGYSSVPFTVACGEEKTPMRVFAGVLAMEQEKKTLALRPKILWATGREPQPGDEL
ncbi:MAG TPA: DUF4419 domain-containing protein [Planctomycetota bacterium]|nr:DUF4419 domain-containing protein [Planctomycetota bacterium]